MHMQMHIRVTGTHTHTHDQPIKSPITAYITNGVLISSVEIC